jgi:hypothetical protein
MKYPFVCLVWLLLFNSVCANDTRWKIQEDGSILWKIDSHIPHFDHIEMSGEKVSSVLRYGVNKDGSFKMEMSLIWPMLRRIPNNTHASFMQKYTVDYINTFKVDGSSISKEEVTEVKLNGFLSATSNYWVDKYNEPTIKIEQVYFPSMDKPALCQRFLVYNITSKPINLHVPQQRRVFSSPFSRGVDGSYTQVLETHNSGDFKINPGECVTIDASVSAYKDSEKILQIDNELEQINRLNFIRKVSNNLIFNSPDEILNTAFAFAKIRASESIFKTKGGYMHGPGGESYYAAIWTNDQAEYVNPFFPFLGYDIGNLSAINSFRHFTRFMNPDYHAIPSSIIAEGDDIWNGAGDRGDCAMIAYGAARYALTRANVEESKELWNLITWCLEYCRLKLNEEGVVMSDSDELEGRFPAGDANLCTSSLYYDALISASYLAKELGLPKSISENYQKEAKVLRKNINKFFGATVEGFDTYQYYEGNDKLRSWICIPLTVGLDERKEGTIQALFSPKLWTKDGLLTQSGTETFWDRSTLYAMRGVFAAGETATALAYLKHYSTERLLGEHVPYAIEAWPEGSQRHLSAESGLYCRIINEGMFGFRPTGHRNFNLTPRLPKDWDKMELKNVWACSAQPYDIKVERVNDTNLTISILVQGAVLKKIKAKEGATVEIAMK